MQGEQDLNHASTGLSRRRLVKTAGHAAWAAPVIVAASAAPAFAGSPGAAVIATSVPSFTQPASHVRATTFLSNLGTVAPASMTIEVTITPVLGALADVDPTVLDPTEYQLVGRNLDGTTGVHTMQFIKIGTQIAPGSPSNFRIDFFHEAGVTMRDGLYSVVPSVPFPGSATGNSDNY